MRKVVDRWWTDGDSPFQMVDQEFRLLVSRTSLADDLRLCRCRVEQEGLLEYIARRSDQVETRRSLPSAGIVVFNGAFFIKAKIFSRRGF